MSTISRRYDIDWLRVIAIALLLIYHIAIGFQPWGAMMGFIASEESWESLWIPMMMLNVWRIPLLFFVSGMGVYFAIQNRSWKQLIVERTRRILLPFLFGMIFIVPLHLYLWQGYHHISLNYVSNPGHLWFLGNIFIYVAVLSPVFFYLKKNETGKWALVIKKIYSNPIGLLTITGAFIAETLLVPSVPYTLYAMTWHGFILGLFSFFFGYCLVFSGRPFWEMIVKWRWLFLFVGLMLFILRWVYFQGNAPGYFLVVESHGWIFSVFAFGHKSLNHPSKALSYLSQAAYPVYIIHMIFLYLGSILIFPLTIPVPFQFLMVLIFTVLGCLITYELVIRRITLVRLFFGVKKK